MLRYHLRLCCKDLKSYNNPTGAILVYAATPAHSYEFGLLSGFDTAGEILVNVQNAYSPVRCFPEQNIIP